MSHTPQGPPRAGSPGELLQTHFQDAGDEGYHHSLSNLQIQMIAIGGAIGVGLFLGIGEPLSVVGPGLVVSYLLVGTLVYMMMRALGEMVLYRPTTGAWVSYAREFVSDRFAHLTGWIYVMLAAMAGVVELAASGCTSTSGCPTCPAGFRPWPPFSSSGSSSSR